MKLLLTLLTVGSIGLNLLLAGLLFRGGASPAKGPGVSPESVGTTRAPTGVAAPDEQTWSKVQSEDLPAMVAQLRDAGFPPHLVRAIMAGRLREIYGARVRALDPGAESRPFWLNPTVDGPLLQAQRKLYAEEQKALRDLVGPDEERAELMALQRGQRLDSVPPGKLEEVRGVLTKYEELRSDIYLSGVTGPEQMQRISAIDTQQRAELATVLSAQELFEYELRSSDTARNLRTQLFAFEPTEEEFRAVFRLQADFDARMGRVTGVLAFDEQQRRSEAQRQLNEQIKATLGPVRGADYERASDFYYRQTSQLVSRLELPADTTNQVWTLKKEIEDRAVAVRRNQDLPAAERMQQLNKLAEEAAQRLTPLLGGNRGFEAYKQYGGSWMRSLTPPPPRPVPPGAR